MFCIYTMVCIPKEYKNRIPGIATGKQFALAQQDSKEA